MEPSPREQAIAPYLYSVRKVSDGKYAVEGHKKFTPINAFQYDTKGSALIVAAHLNAIIDQMYDDGVKDGFDIGWMANSYSGEPNES